MNKDRYFSHNVSAHSDPKISALISKYGMQGYGFFWLILEHMAKTERVSLPLKNYMFQSLTASMTGKPDARIVHVKRLIDDCINEFELFKVDPETGEFYSDSLRERLELAETTRLKRVDAGLKSALNRGLEKANQHVLNNVGTMFEHSSNTTQQNATNKNINRNKNINKKVQLEKDTASAVGVQEHLFSESPYFNFELFKREIESDPDYCEINGVKTNIGFYYESIKNWSASKNKKSFDWLATAKTFIQNGVKPKRTYVPKPKSFPNTWARDYALKLKPDQYMLYVQHLKSLGFERKQSPGGGEYYSKN